MSPHDSMMHLHDDAMTLKPRTPRERLNDVGLRPTRQRLSLAKLMFDGGDRHFTAEDLQHWAKEADVSVSLATIYNTLNQFRDVGLLREVIVGGGRSFFDTNLSDHHHFYIEPQGDLVDIPADAVEVRRLPKPPEGMEYDRVDVVVRVRSKA